MTHRALSTVIIAAAACAHSCGPSIQRAAFPTVAVVNVPALGTDGAKAPAGEQREPTRFVVRANDSKFEVTGSDLATGSHVMQCDRWNGAFVVDPASPPDRPTGHLTLDVDLTTLQTDADVVSFLKYDLLEVDRHPNARLVATVVPRTDQDDGHVIEGRILLHGVERDVRFFASVRADGAKYRIDAVFDISRKAFDIRRRDAMDVFINEDFRIVIGLLAHPEPASAEVDPAK